MGTRSGAAQSAVSAGPRRSGSLARASYASDRARGLAGIHMTRYVTLPLLALIALAWVVSTTSTAAESPSDAKRTRHSRTIYLIRHGAYVPDEKADPEK